MLTVIQESTGRPLVLDVALAAGGEGTIYTIPSQPDRVAKIYHQTTPAEKLRIMIAYPPTGAPTLTKTLHGGMYYAWPLDRLLDNQSNYCGFIMPFVDPATSVIAHELYNPQARHRVWVDMTYRDLVHCAANLAKSLVNLHAGPYIVGDLNESNLLVSRLSQVVTLVDCDSIQVTDGQQVFRCEVGKGDYLPPELQGVWLPNVTRDWYHDTFGLAVLVFMMLMEGFHPYDGIWQSAGSAPLRELRIQQRLWPYDPRTARGRITPPPIAPSYLMLPPEIRGLMRRCFVEGTQVPIHRPTAQEWYEALVRMEQQLDRCPVNPHHAYPAHLGAQCPWCERRARFGFDPFPAPKTTRSPTRPAPPPNPAPPAPNVAPPPIRPLTRPTTLPPPAPRPLPPPATGAFPKTTQHPAPSPITGAFPPPVLVPAPPRSVPPPAAPLSPSPVTTLAPGNVPAASSRTAAPVAPHRSLTGPIRRTRRTRQGWNALATLGLLLTLSIPWAGLLGTLLSLSFCLGALGARWRRQRGLWQVVPGLAVDLGALGFIALKLAGIGP